MNDLDKNFAFLARHSPMLYFLGVVAERRMYAFPDDAVSRLKQFGVVLAEQLAAFLAVELPQGISFEIVINTLGSQGNLNPHAVLGFHTLREGLERADLDMPQAIVAIWPAVKMASALGAYYHTLAENRTYQAKPFSPPLRAEQFSEHMTSYQKSVEGALRVRMKERALARISEEERRQFEVQTDRLLVDLAEQHQAVLAQLSEEAVDQLEHQLALATDRQPELLEALRTTADSRTAGELQQVRADAMSTPFLLDEWEFELVGDEIIWKRWPYSTE